MAVAEINMKCDKWVMVGRNEDFSLGLHLVDAGRLKVVLAVLDGELYAFDAFCPHSGGPLELSEAQGHVISCPLHAWRFDLKKDGCEIHGYRPLKLFDVKVEHGDIFVSVPEADS